MLRPAWLIRDCRQEDMEIIRRLFALEGMGDLTDPDGIRVAVTFDNTIYGACRLERGSDGSMNVRPIVVFDAVQGRGVGRSLIKDALKRYPDLVLVSRGEVEPFYLSCGFTRATFNDAAPEFAAECAACPDSESCKPHVYKSLPVKRTLTFLGTSSGCGVPAFFCHCPACEEARRDPSKRRTCTGVVLRGHATTLVDAPPDLRAQLVREGIDEIDEFFLTHAHFDHMGGFGELEYFIRLHRDGTIPFRASPYSLQECFKEFSYMDDCFEQDALEPYDAREFDGMKIQALPLVHCPGCYGYLITTPEGRRTFYAPDTSEISGKVAEILHGVDNLIMDATYWGENGRPKTHRSAQETISFGLDELEANRVYLQHLAPHMSAPEDNWIENMYEYARRFDGRVVVAEDGMVVEL